MSDDKVAKRLQWFHLARLVVWTVQVPSTPYIVFLSLAALIEGAGSAYMASRAERS